ncbi:hypothetical protein DFH07DRAFT_1055398 [Mycena maculata]|uniref:DUF6534 domain-containing protein n=1 Tax=Mycena maculata TaxID=230809 RepID=A0AAD7NZV2_9AGAR|nr:hypothetical protein DFH07DRAFT_1055398 [Mycena maculata]
MAFSPAGVFFRFRPGTSSPTMEIFKSEGPAERAHGPMLVGFLFNAILYGVMILQTHIYFINYGAKDRLWMRAFVLSIFVLDSMNTVFDFIYLYKSLIIHFDDPPYLRNATWVFATDPALTALIAGMVQFFFAWRVRILTNKNTFLYLVVVLCATAGLVGGLATAAEAIITPEFAKFQKAKPYVALWLSAECIADFLITTILVWHLKRRKTGFQKTDMLVDRIITMTVHTGVLTSVCAILDLILYLVDPTGLHLAFNFPLCKLYTNSLISSLNCRSGWGYSEGSGSAGSTDEKTACLSKPVPPPPQPKAAVMKEIDVESLSAPDHNEMAGPAPRKDSEATFVGDDLLTPGISAPRKDEAEKR